MTHEENRHPCFKNMTLEENIHPCFKNMTVEENIHPCFKNMTHEENIHPCFKGKHSRRSKMVPPPPRKPVSPLKRKHSIFQDRLLDLDHDSSTFVAGNVIIGIYL